ncbi:unnamed protein product [Polarella glacialis]|uniref:Uncharacterized protein n=1 Tax=Polarella glacialis TaxID=89957 RepID=A0A813JG92_POLGL|nr:unnamed protein product [Polarella glacialis]
MTADDPPGIRCLDAGPQPRSGSSRALADGLEGVGGEASGRTAPKSQSQSQRSCTPRRYGRPKKATWQYLFESGTQRLRGGSAPPKEARGYAAPPAELEASARRMFEISEDRRMEKVQQRQLAQAKQIEQELRQCTFTPHINACSAGAAPRLGTWESSDGLEACLSLYERGRLSQERIKEKAQEARHIRASMEMSQCTFHPELTSCSGRARSRLSRPPSGHADQALWEARGPSDDSDFTQSCCSTRSPSSPYLQPESSPEAVASSVMGLLASWKVQQAVPPQTNRSTSTPRDGELQRRAELDLFSGRRLSARVADSASGGHHPWCSSPASLQLCAKYKTCSSAALVVIGTPCYDASSLKLPPPYSSGWHFLPLPSLVPVLIVRNLVESRLHSQLPRWLHPLMLHRCSGSFAELPTTTATTTTSPTKTTTATTTTATTTNKAAAVNKTSLYPGSSNEKAAPSEQQNKTDLATQHRMSDRDIRAHCFSVIEKVFGKQLIHLRQPAIPSLQPCDSSPSIVASRLCVLQTFLAVFALCTMRSFYSCHRLQFAGVCGLIVSCCCYYCCCRCCCCCFQVVGMQQSSSRACILQAAG